MNSFECKQISGFFFVTIFNNFQATKISSGLALKKKNVGSLVAKWQNIQQEVKRNQ